MRYQRLQANDNGSGTITSRRLLNFLEGSVMIILRHRKHTILSDSSGIGALGCAEYPI